ncbi:MAG: type II secretion system minor pseudopilin GspK [Rudaea sp.]|nr:type II secretion system minor pseudopilin GspK [Rudaea sp.]
MRPPPRIAAQRGVALLVALLVVALAVVLIAGLLDRGELTAARTRNQLRTIQAEAYAQGLEDYAARVLMQDDANGGQSDTSNDIWAVPLPPTPVPGGEITATMSDLSGRFNLNNLYPLFDTSKIWFGKFQLLLIALKLDPNLAQVVVDWMSIDTGGGGSSDGFYLALPQPYRSAKNIFFHVSELRLLQGVSGDVYAQLAPYVSALPPGTLINVNTASVPVLMTLSTLSPITQQTAQALWQQGHANFQTLEAFQSAATGVIADCGAAPAPGSTAQQQLCFSVRSTYFLARGQITLDGLPFVFYSVIERRRSGPDGGYHVIQRSRGADG